MSDNKLRNLKTQLKLGLCHIEKALCLAERRHCFELCSQGKPYIHTLSAAKDHIQDVLRTGFPSSVENDRFCDYVGTPNCGCDPMRTKFLGIGGLFEKDVQKRDLQQGNIHSGAESGVFFRSPSMGVKSVAELRYCKVCKVMCNSPSQWKHHVEGHQHQGRLEVEDPPQRIKLRHISKRNSTFSDKMVRKADEFCPIRYEKSECNPPKGRRCKTKVAEISKRGLYGNRQNRTLMWCELCDVTCNSNLQYLSHIEGKRHQMEVEQCQRI